MLLCWCKLINTHAKIEIHKVAAIQQQLNGSPRRSPRQKNAKIKIHKEVKKEKDENAIKRSLSYSDALVEESPSKKKTRTLKSPEERTLRKNLKLKLKGLERRLLAGDFHHDTKNLKTLKVDCFKDAVRPYIYELIGESDENPNMIVQAERLASRDIVKKRLY